MNRHHTPDPRMSHDVHRYRSRGRLATVLQGLLFLGAAGVAGLWGLGIRTACLQVVLPFFVVDRWLTDLPLLGGPLELVLGVEATLIDLMALGLAAGSIGLYALTTWCGWHLVTRPRAGSIRARLVGLTSALALCAVVGLGDLQLGSLEATTIDLLLQADEQAEEEVALDLPLSSIPTLEQLEADSGWVMIDEDGIEVPIDQGSLARAARWGGRIFLLGHGVCPALVLAIGLALAAARFRELPYQV
jgi:hypothetical protein